MQTTRAFKSGNSQAVRIPAALAYADISGDLRITRVGDVITIFPVRPSLKDTIAQLRALPLPSDIEPREAIEVPDRAWD